MTITFQYNVPSENTVHNLNGFFLTIIATRMIGAGFKLKIDNSVDEVMEVMDLNKVYADCLTLAGEQYTDFLKQEHKIAKLLTT